MEIEKTNIDGQEEQKTAMGASMELKDKKVGMEGQGDGVMGAIKSFLDFSFETIRVVIVSLIIIFVVRSFVIQPFFVKGSSMEPNFQDGNYLIVNEIGYRLEEPKRGDVIVFRYPNDTSEFFIKRVIGLPGETLEIKDGSVKIYNQENPLGFLLDESTYLANSVVTAGSLSEELGGDEYFVLGDNRGASSDSRRWGKLSKHYIIGKAWVRAWPFENFAVFESFNY
ncbi:MAG: signal peptidase I [Candidatus Pacebacteria bacterium]|nr:signal peptidase I [Candidatus Paceibacterota bacterium]